MTTTTQDEKILITGIGPVCATAIGFDRFKTALAEGRSGVAEVTAFDVEQYRSKLAAEIIDFDVRPFLASEKGYLDRNSALAFAAARLALDDARCVIPPELAASVGLCLGTCFGNMETARAFYQRILEKGPKLAPPFIFPHTYNTTTASLIAIEYGLTGPHANFSSGAAAGAEAVAYAALNLRAGRAQVMLAGGVEALSQPAFKALDAARRLTPLPTPAAVQIPAQSPQSFTPQLVHHSFSEGGSAIRNPQSSDSGFVLGEGACVLILETQSHVEQRNARVYAELAGVGIAGDPRGAIANALQDARITADEIRLVASAANGLFEMDSQESQALANILAGRNVTMLYAKSLLGETFGASGPLNVAAVIAKLGEMRRDRNAQSPAYALVNAIEPDTLAVSLVLKLSAVAPPENR